jgi:NADPH:quinone reductase-like Zn-dependent oxidoreductase
MKAMLIREYGGPDVFEFGDIEIPEVRDNELLVRVMSSSVNPVDTAIRQGMLRFFNRLSFPAVPGVDAAGEVVGKGMACSRFGPGDHVYAFMGIKRNGGYGEYISVPEEFAAKCPPNISMDVAGTVPGVGMTAMEAFTVHAPLKPGMKVLITGAGGGVGTYAVQIAASMGSEVTAVCASRNIRLVRDLGAGSVIDYSIEDVLQTPVRFDVILNCVRTMNNLSLKNLLKPYGKLIYIAGNPASMPRMVLSNLFSDKKARMFFVQTSGTILEQLSDLIATGKVRPVVEKIYSWHELPDAHRHMEAGKVTGKIGIKMGMP